MKASLTLDTRRHYRAMRDMAKLLSATSLRSIVDYETGRTLEGAARNTKFASRKSIIATFEKYAMQDNTVPTVNPNRPYTLPDGTKRSRNWRLSNDKWQAYKAHREARMKEKIARAGLASQAWAQIADDLQIPVSGPAINRGRKARVGGRVIRPAGTLGRRGNEGTQKQYNMINYTNLLGRWTGARGALQRAINGRAAYFKKNLENRVFRDASSIAKRYPGLTVQ